MPFYRWEDIPSRDRPGNRVLRMVSTDHATILRVEHHGPVAHQHARASRAERGGSGVLHPTPEGPLSQSGKSMARLRSAKASALRRQSLSGLVFQPTLVGFVFSARGFSLGQGREKREELAGLAT